ncbi:permease-like cell division protein FtsX [Olsenella sp. An270]|uniref:permease-like cell division protein FtsX n=1 Tax=Olsenella sp. An270 TaxID=1965615 RepID=UPI000B395402|nr:permease-like cell division protein FtsX [Olsenella sp. An270]OUO58923.1 cell division protein [Olsenella sp. An270]
MVPSNLGYSLREAGHHFRRNWTTVLGAIVTIFLSLFIIGLFVLGSVMISSVVGGVEDSVTIQAYLSDDASDSAVESLQSKIEGWDNVESVTYKSKDEALEDYRTSMSNRNASDAVAALDGENPLPASLVITLTDPQEVAATAERIMDDSSFLQIRDTADDPESSPADDVVYGQGTVDRLFEVTNYIRLGAVALVIMLTFVAFVFINNTIRLAITARRREIAIMRLVGASNSFIRGPFVTEGVLESLIAALLAIAALAGGLHVLMPMLQQNLSFLAFDVPTEVLYATFGGLLLIGILIGLFGSAIAMRRYLKV